MDSETSGFEIAKPDTLRLKLPVGLLKLLKYEVESYRERRLGETEKTISFRDG